MLGRGLIGDRRLGYRRQLRLESLEDRRMMAVITVTTNSDVVDLADGVVSLREAVFVANTAPGADEINFDFGHDGPETIVLTQGELAITDSVTISGAGAGLLTIDASGNDPTPDSSLVDEDTTNDGDGSRTFNISDGNAATQIDVTIAGLTITGGDVLQHGGGILSVERTKLSGVVLRQNQATGFGGGIHQDTESLMIVGSHVIDNHATPGITTGGGGGISLRTAGMQVEDSTISGNSSRTGGGIRIREGNQSVSIKNSHIDGNSTRGGGAGGIWRDGNMALEIFHSTISNNVSSGRGGAMEVLGRGAFLLEDSSVSGNTANGQSFSSTAGGGGIVIESEASSVGNTLVIRRSTISGNHAKYDGGGLHLNWTSTLLIEDSEISGNTANWSGGGIFGSGQNSLPAGSFPLQIRRTRIVGNGAREGGNAIHLAGNQNGGQVGQGTAAIIESSEISGNQHLSNGFNNLGAIYARAERLTVIDTALAGNDGAAINFKTSSTIVPALIVTSSAIAPGSEGIRSQGGAVQLNYSSLTGSFRDSVYVTGAALSMTGSEVRDSAGRGVYVLGGNASLSDVTISGNNGTGVSVHNGNLTVSASTISGNTSTSGAGGVNLSSTLTHSLRITDSTISDNAGSDGGGVHSTESTYIADSVIARNRASLSGGGIRTVDRLVLLRSAVSENQAISASGTGGGIAVNGGDLVQIQDSSVSNNSTGGWGGGIESTVTVRVMRSSIFGNTAVTRGGGIHAQGREVSVTDSTVARNRTKGGPGTGGGILGGAVTITQSTVSGNVVESSGFGGGIFATSLVLNQSTVVENHTLSAGAIGGGVSVQNATQLNNSIVAGNTAGGSNPDIKTGTFVTPAYSLIGNTAGLTTVQLNVINAGTGNLLNQDAKLGPLSDNGGTTFADGTRMLTHALLAGSPAIDVGNPLVQGPVALYRFEESAGATVVKDSIGNHDGTYHGGPTFGQTNPYTGSSAVTFDGVDDYATLPATVANDFTISLWIKTSQTESNARFALLDADATNAVPGFNLYIQNGRVGFRSVTSSVTVNDGNWHHVAATRNAATGASSVFIDGVQRGSASIGPTGALADVAEWSIGRFMNGTVLYAGQMDELAFYDGVLSAADITRLAAGGAPAFDERGWPHLRVLDGDNTGGARIDMGAYERQFGETYNFVVDTLVDESDGDYSAGDFSLREAIELANANPGKDVIAFDPVLWANGPATIVLSQLGNNTGLNSGLAIYDSLTLEGPGAELLAIDASGLDPTPELNNGDGGRVMEVSDVHNMETMEVEISGLTIRGGDVGSDGSAYVDGGGIRVHLSQITLRDCVITDNSTMASGGGVAMSLEHSQNPSIIERCTFVGNYADWGGGLSTNTSNHAPTIVRNSLFVGNVAGNAGGAIHASSSGFLTPQPVILESSTLSGNLAQQGGGLYFLSALGAIVRSSTITNNAASSSTGAGGIFAYADEAIVQNSIIAGNRAGDGSSSDLGRRINAVFGNDGSFAISHSLIGTNLNSGYAEAPVGAGDASGNFIGGPIGGAIDPKLGPLANNGGPTKSHALLPGSPALDAGDPAAVAGMDGVPVHDQRGGPWSRVAGGRIDIGAVESQANLLPGDYNFNGVVDAADYTLWRDTLGSTDDLRADGTSAAAAGVPDGVVDELDYAFWKANFGNQFVFPQSMGGGSDGSDFASESVAGELRLAGVSEGAVSAGGLDSGVGSVSLGGAFTTAPARRSSPAIVSRARGFELVRDEALLAWHVGRADAAAAGEDHHADEAKRDSEATSSDHDEAFAVLSCEL